MTLAGVFTLGELWRQFFFKAGASYENHFLITSKKMYDYRQSFTHSYESHRTLWVWAEGSPQQQSRNSSQTSVELLNWTLQEQQAALVHYQ